MSSTEILLVRARLLIRLDDKDSLSKRQLYCILIVDTIKEIEYDYKGTAMGQ
jgi:hypothetical protein